MIEITQRARAARPRAAPSRQLVSFLRSLDWILMLAAAGLVGFGLWVVSGITRFDVPGDQDYFVVRQGFAAAIGAVGLRRRRTRAGGPVAPVLEARLRHDPRTDDRGVRGRRGRPRLEALARPRRHPVPAVGAREGPLRARDRRLRRRPRGPVARWKTIFTVLGLGAAPILLVFMQPDLGTALVYAAALFAVLFFVGLRWRQLLSCWPSV